MQVKATPGTRCPKEGKPRDYIDDKTPQEVPDSAYYMRLVTDGSLVVAPEKKPVKRDEGKVKE